MHNKKSTGVGPRAGNIAAASPKKCHLLTHQSPRPTYLLYLGYGLAGTQKTFYLGLLLAVEREIL